ncbi:MAG TPA: Nramp family divalent metal transporter [Steroidobacteraceae bacterium]|nr:Nramp family divalent metal transporter [Steroidobacteraceae bacterium]
MIPSLPEVNRSVRIAETGPWLQRLAGFLGPGCLVAVGYMDPGNWATDLAGGSAYGYSLLWIVALSSLAAMLLQALAVRLGVATGMDLAQVCRASYSARATRWYWLSCEIAICATDLAEVIGTAIGLQLLFGIPLVWGVPLTALDVLVILWLQQRSFRYVEAVVTALILVVGVCFALNLLLTQLHWQALGRGLLPHADILSDPNKLYLAVGIIGATVMPHNLYLHSSIVQTRRYRRDRQGKRSALQFASVDTVGALSLAFVVNAGLLVLAAAVLHAAGHHDVIGIQQTYRLLAPVLGAGAAVLFGLALIASGQASALSATLAGQVVMEGLLNWRIAPWARRLLTRAIALLPAFAVAVCLGEHGIARLLILSQAILSLQLPFAIVPLIRFTSDPRRMGALVSPRWLRLAGWSTAAIIMALNGVLLVQFVGR